MSGRKCDDFSKNMSKMSRVTICQCHSVVLETKNFYGLKFLHARVATKMGVTELVFEL